MCALAWLAVTCANAGAQPASSVAGRVLDEVTARGLAGARVELLPQGRLTLTSVDGAWLFDGVGPGEHTLRVMADGYEAVTLPVAVSTSQVAQQVMLRRRPYRAHESVVVTASRESATAFDVPRSVSVVDSTELDRRMPRSTPEALWDTAGVFVQKTNHGGGSPYLRGLIGNQVLVLVDGIRLNNATFRYGPNQYLATLDPGAIDRIEVLRGSGSVLYGSDAIGGVINVVTRRPERVGQPLAWGVNATSKLMTSDMEQSGRLEVALTGPKAGVQGGFTLRNVGDLRAGGGLGIEAPSGYGEMAGDARAEISISTRQRLTFAYQQHEQDDVPRYDQVAQRGFARYAFDPQVRQLGWGRWERFSSAPWVSTLRATASLQRSDERREYRRQSSSILTAERDEVLTSGLSVEVQSRLHPALSLVSGVEHYADTVDSSRRDLDQSSLQEIERRGLYADGATSSSLAVFSQATLNRSRWRVDGGVRVTRIDVSAPDARFGSARVSPVTPTSSVGALFTVSEGVRLFGSVSQAFRAPNIDDLSSLGQFDFGIEVPSPNLRPESSVMVEGGVKMHKSIGGASVAVYRTSLDNLIERVPGLLDGAATVDGQAVYQKSNIGSAFIRGVELDGELALASSLTVAGSLTYTYGAIPSRDEPLRRIPPLNGLVAVRATPGTRVWLEGSLRFADRQSRLSPGDLADHRIPSGGTPGWRVFNIHASYEVSDRWRVVGALQNLFDGAYRTHGSGIDGQGRSAWIGLHARIR